MMTITISFSVAVFAWLVFDESHNEALQSTTYLFFFVNRRSKLVCDTLGPSTEHSLQLKADAMCKDPHRHTHLTPSFFPCRRNVFPIQFL